MGNTPLYFEDGLSWNIQINFASSRGRMFRRADFGIAARFVVEIISHKSHYVRNMTEGIQFTFMGLKDAEHIGTALRKVQLSYG
jgi:hypothetical protein